MFLATTADQRFWKNDEQILFLGEWCKTYDQKHVWEKLNHSTLPYHWYDREKLFQDHRYVETLYAKQMKYLSEKLNAIHNVDQSIRYWKILIGPWLSYTLSVLLDRYLSIKTAMESGMVTNTWIISPQELHIAKDTHQFQRWCWTDQFNHYLYGKIIKESGGISYELKKEFENDLFVDEYMFDSVQVNIPSLSLQKYPYDQYHTSNDEPSHIEFADLQKAYDITMHMVNSIENDKTYELAHPVPFWMTRFDLYSDFHNESEDHQKRFNIVYKYLDGKNSNLQIADLLDCKLEEVSPFIDAMAENKLAKELPMNFGVKN